MTGRSVCGNYEVNTIEPLLNTFGWSDLWQIMKTFIYKVDFRDTLVQNIKLKLVPGQVEMFFEGNWFVLF